MKVLLANYRYFVSSGPERYMFNIANRLEAAGHAVMPFSVRYAKNVETPYAKYFVPPLGGEDEVFFDEHRTSPAALIRTVSRLFYSPQVERAVARMVDETNPDIAYVLYYLRKLSPSLLVGLKKRGLPIVVRLSDYGMFCPEHHCLRDHKPCTLCQTGNVFHSVRHKCLKNSYAVSLLEALATSYHRMRGYFDLIDAFVATNPFMREMMIKAGYSAQQIHCIPTFTDIDKFAPATRPTDERYILFAGRLDRPKGVNVLLNAMTLLQQRGSKYMPMLKIAGEGHNAGYVAGLKQQAENAGLQDKVAFLGNVAPGQVPDLLKGAICSVMPALWFENLPNTLVESLACGIPVIASNIGSLSSAITDGVDGLLFRPGDASDLAEKIDLLARNPQLREKLSQNSRQTALRKYSPDVHVEDLLKLFENLIRQPQRVAS